MEITEAGAWQSVLVGEMQALRAGIKDLREEKATRGSIIQTWSDLAIAAATFWVCSSLAGKMTRKP